jgi:hypothetical protein
MESHQGDGLVLYRIARCPNTLKACAAAPQDVAARARSVREVLSFVEQKENPVLCIAPEGADMPGGKLAWPPSGAGRFMLLLSARSLPITPVGGWEDEAGALCIRFGPAFELSVPSGLSPDEKDRVLGRG